MELLTQAFLILCINNAMKSWQARYIHSQKGAKNTAKDYFKTKRDNVKRPLQKEPLSP